MNLDIIREKIINYIKSFDQESENVKLKYYHTLQVEDLMKELAIKLSLSDEDIILSRIIALLHDIGRFEQIKTYGSMVDKNTVDHADFGVELLFKEGLIKEFDIPNHYYNIIEKTIRLHNKLNIKEELDPKEELFVKMIRDTDKIDIYRVRAHEVKNIFYDEPTGKVLRDFYDEKPINLMDKKTKSDSIIIVMAFIYDINFLESFQVLKQKKYYKEFLKSVEVDEELIDTFNRLKEKAVSYIDEKVYGDLI